MKKIDINKKGNWAKDDINLITLISNESTKGARKILKDYGIEDAKNHLDLELKLSKLYLDNSNKIEIEKRFYEIHPHKDWIIKMYNLINAEKIQKDETKLNKSGVDSNENETDKILSLIIKNEKIITNVCYGIIGLMSISFILLILRK
ncbi:MAG: hypothetical protein QXM96_00290 [Candidatus Woesearchaeota archaeon]